MVDNCSVTGIIKWKILAMNPPDNRSGNYDIYLMARFSVEFNHGIMMARAVIAHVSPVTLSFSH